MARHIDADKLIEELKSLSITVTGFRGGKGYLSEIVKEYKDSILRIVDEQPAADVVPKSEVDRAYQRGFERGKKDNVCGFSAEEIAQKVEKIAIELEAMRMAANSYKMHYENARVEVAREIFEEIEKVACVYKLDGDFYLDNGIYTELKKKYTEGEI